jgi:transcriptional regulator with XRE-family HTH domain
LCVGREAVVHLSTTDLKENAMGEEPGINNPEELELNKAVYLSVYERNPANGRPLTQEQIAQRLGTTREQVNRYLQRARQRGILRAQYEPLSEEMLDRVILDLNYTDIEAVLQEFAERHRETNEGRLLQSVTVVCEELPCNRQGSWDESLLRFGPLTAAKTKQYVKDLARSSSPILGVAWGRTLRCVVDAVGPGDFAEVRGRSHVQCIPLWGEVWGPEIPEWKGTVFTNRSQLSSSTLARDLEAKLKRRDGTRRRHSLEAVPVMLPRELAKHNAILFEYLTKVSAWGEIFGEGSGETVSEKEKVQNVPLAEQLQLVLVGTGSSESPGRFLSPEVLKNILTERDADRLLKLVYGDVGGVLMEKPGLSRSDQAFLDGISASWTGVREQHLRECAARASAGAGVGVVVYAIDRSRAEPILEAIRRGIVTHLVTEMGLAAELKRLSQRTIRSGRRSNE